MPTHPVYRAARAVVFATVCVGLAITGHTMASGEPVPVAAAAGGLAALTLVGLVLAGTERSLPTILALLFGGQFMLHAVFDAAQHGQHLAHGHPVPPVSGGGGAMTAAHVAAAVVSAWWLRRGERAVWGLAKRAAAGVLRRALPLAPPPPPPRTPRPLATAAPGPRPARAVLRHVLVRRGPPAPWEAPA
jgi:hypothetical protein